MVCIHAGFMMYEMGASRVKNSLASGTKNILAANADIILTGQGEDDKFGVTVAGISDLNGDGFGELVIGAQISLATDSAGEVFIYSGQALWLDTLVL